MSGEKATSRSWFVDLGSDAARLRCSFHRRGRRIVRFTVQLEIIDQDKWRPVVRYDNAHGFCHRDTLHADGTQDKTGVYIGDVNETFTYAIDDLRTNWAIHRSRYQGGERIMIDPHDFARRQLELTAEFGKYVFDHPEMDEHLAEGAYVYFHIEGETEFNRYSRELAERRRREEGVATVLVRIKGLVPPQGSRLIDPVIEATPLAM